MTEGHDGYEIAGSVSRVPAPSKKPQLTAHESAHLLTPSLRLERPAAVHDDGSKSAPDQDGRRARGQRNRDAVIDAILILLDQGNVSPTAREIADAAGVSLRSVFRHFSDLDSLFGAAIQRQARRTAHLYEPPSRAGDTDQRIASLVAQRRKLYETISEVRRSWILRYSDVPSVSHILEEIYVGLHLQVVEFFHDDLAQLPPVEQRDVLDAIDVATSFDAWAHLRSHRGLSVPRTSAVVKRTVRLLIADARSLT